MRIASKEDELHSVLRQEVGTQHRLAAQQRCVFGPRRLPASKLGTPSRTRFFASSSLVQFASFLSNEKGAKTATMVAAQGADLRRNKEKGLRGMGSSRKEMNEPINERRKDFAGVGPGLREKSKRALPHSMIFTTQTIHSSGLCPMNGRQCKIASRLLCSCNIRYPSRDRALWEPVEHRLSKDCRSNVVPHMRHGARDTLMRSEWGSG
jgi:hypothetical protein